MDYSNTGAVGGNTVQPIVQNNVAEQIATNANAAPVVTESIDLEAIYQQTYDAEMAKYQAEIDAANAQAAAANIATIVSYDQYGLADLQQQSMANLIAASQIVPQDLTQISTLLSNNTPSPIDFGEGGITPGGFIMPTGVQKETVYKIIAAEGGEKSPQEAVNIASTMINRARAGNYGGGNDIYKIATAPSQYAAYENNSYASKALTPEARAAVDQLFASTASGGATAHQYKSFRSNDNDRGVELSPGGNKYR